MKSFIFKLAASIDWYLFLSAVFLSIAGIITISTFSVSGAETGLAFRQSIWLIVSTVVLALATLVDWRFLRDSRFITSIFIFSVLVLLALFVVGSVFKGARSWFDLGLFAFQPTDFAKLALVLVLSKYFSRRHIEIANVRHIFLSGFYAFIIFILVLLQPDFGSGVIIFLIWFGMVLLSGLSKKHLLAVFSIGLLSFLGLWFFVFQDYQKARISSFLHPLSDIRGSGYNAYQSTIAVGSGQIFGKGIGYGTQSKLKFLPEYETDFIFASFAEEWGFVGVTILLSLYGVLLGRILYISYHGETNFEMLFGLGLAIIFISHLGINIGMNIGLLPVTGITLPFMSYGGSHLLMEFFALGMLLGMKKYNRVAHREEAMNEVIGIN